MLRKLFLFLALAVASWGADTTLYVNTASTTGGTCLSNSTTGDDRACPSLSEAEAKIPADITTGANQGIWTILCEGQAADTTPVTFNGTTASATYYVEVKTNPAAAYGRHDGKLNANKYRLAVANATAITVADEYIRLDGLQIIKTSSSVNDQACVTTTSIAAGGSDIRISNCILKQAGNSSYREPGIYNADADAALTIWNTIVYGAGGSTSSSNACLVTLGPAKAFNCTFVGATFGVRVASGSTLIAKNCYARGTTAAYSIGGTFTATTCAASDTSGTPDSLDSIALDTANFTNVTAGSEDFHLPLGSALIGVGTDNPGSGLFSDDIDGQARASTWDIGADEYAPPTRHRVYVIARGRPNRDAFIDLRALTARWRR